jgi:hypothetical protein
LISVLTPTRNRPAGVRRLIETACETADGPVELVFYQDEDAVYQDTHVFDIPGYRPDVTVQVLTGPRIVLSQMWNECWEKSTGDIFLLSDDDVAFRSPSWDIKVTEAVNSFPDKIAVVWGRDGFHQPPACATQPFASREWTEVLGYFTPKNIWGYVDKWVYELACRAGRGVYLEDVFTEHLHYLNGKSEFDQTYQDRVDREQNYDVAKEYADREAERAGDVQKLRDAISAFAQGRT